jgi:hypothetical protein
LTPAIPTAGSAVPMGVGAGVGAGVGVGTVEEAGVRAGADPMVFVGSGLPEPAAAVNPEPPEALDPPIVGASVMPDSVSDAGSVSLSEIGATAGTGSAEHPTIGVVIRAAKTAAGITSGQRDRRMRMSRQR